MPCRRAVSARPWQAGGWAVEGPGEAVKPAREAPLFAAEAAVAAIEATL